MSTPFHVDPDGEIPDEAAEQISRTIVREKAKRSRNQMPVWLAVAIIALCIGGAVVMFTPSVSNKNTRPPLPTVGFVDATPTSAIADSTAREKSLGSCDRKPVPATDVLVFSTVSGSLLRSMSGPPSLCRLTKDTPADYPAISPDGQHVAYRLTRGDQEIVVVMDVDGTHRNPLIGHLHNVRRIEWSPDSTRLIYQADGIDDRADIFRIDANGKNPVNLTQSSTAEYSPTWLANGNILFIYDDDTRAPDLAMMESDGRRLPMPLKDCPWQYQPEYVDVLLENGQISYVIANMIYTVPSLDEICNDTYIPSTGGNILQVVSTNSGILYYLADGGGQSKPAIYRMLPDGTQLRGAGMPFTPGTGFDVWISPAEDKES